MNFATCPSSALVKRQNTLEKRLRLLNKELATVKGTINARKGLLLGARHLQLCGIVEDQMLNAIKALREVNSPMGLHEAKDACDAIRYGGTFNIMLSRPLDEASIRTLSRYTNFQAIL